MGMGNGISVGAQNLWRVVSGIEADAEKLRSVERGIVGELFVDLVEVAAHARTKIRKRATRVNKSDEHNLAAIVVEGDALAVLIGERKVGNPFAGSGDVH